jgi:hypothetical protein
MLILLKYKNLENFNIKFFDSTVKIFKLILKNKTN